MTFNPDPTPIPRKDDAQAAKQNAVDEALGELETLKNQIGEVCERLRKILKDGR